MRDTFSRTLYDVACKKNDVCITVADISPAGSMEPFRRDYPDRFVNVGVAEQSMIGICAGLALRGCTPFAYSIATFSLYRPFEQIRVDLCYQNLPVTVVGIGGGVCYSTLGGTHHAQEDIAIMGGLPNMAVIAPCDPLETEAATWACAERNGPTYLRLGKAGEPDLTSGAPEPFEFGKVRMIKDGSDVAILAYGPIMKMALDVAANIEATQGRSVAVFSVHTIKPLDIERIADILKNFETVAIVEEHSSRACLGSQVKEVAWNRKATCNILNWSLQDEFIHEFGSQLDVWRAHGLSAENIQTGIEAALDGKESQDGNQSNGQVSVSEAQRRRAS